MLGSFWIVWKRNTIMEPSILQHSTIGDLSINSAPFASSTSGGRRWKQTLYNLPLNLNFPMQNIFPAWRKWWRRALLLHQSWPRLWLWACEGECAGREGEGCQCGHDAWEVNIEFFLPCKDLTNPIFNSDFGVKLSRSWCRSWTSPGPTNTTSRCSVTLRNNTLKHWISANSLPFPKRRQ